MRRNNFRSICLYLACPPLLKFVGRISCLLVISVASYVFAEAEPSYPVIAYLTADNVNVRAGQGVNFEQLWSLKKGDSVVVLGQEYGWYQIRLPQQAHCFVHRDFIESGIVTAEKLRIRAGEGTNFNVLGTLEKGERVEVLEERGPWLRISPTKDCAGWVKQDYLRLTQGKTETKQSQLSLAPTAENRKVELLGIVDDLGKIANRPGAHKLIVDGKSVYYLKSENIDLNNYLYQKVNVSGVLVSLEHCPYPVVEVEQVVVR